MTELWAPEAKVVGSANNAPLWAADAQVVDPQKAAGVIARQWVHRRVEGQDERLVDLSAEGIAAAANRRAPDAGVTPEEVRELYRTPREATGTLRRLGQDTLVAAGKGAVGLPQAAVGIANIPTLGAAGKAVEALGVDFAGAQEILEGAYSPETQLARQRVAEADGVVDTLATAIANPSSIATTVGESLPTMAAGGVAGRALLAAPVAGPALGLLGGWAPAAAAGIGEGLVSAGATAEQIRSQTDSGYLTPGQAAISATSGVATGALGFLGGAAAKYLKLADFDVLLASGAPQQAKRGVLMKVVGGMVSEGVLEELPQSMQEQIAQNVATGRPWSEGVENSAAMGALVGAVMGGGTNATQSLIQGRQRAGRMTQVQQQRAQRQQGRTVAQQAQERLAQQVAESEAEAAAQDTPPPTVENDTASQPPSRPADSPTVAQQPPTAQPSPVEQQAAEAMRANGDRANDYNAAVNRIMEKVDRGEQLSPEDAKAIGIPASQSQSAEDRTAWFKRNRKTLEQNVASTQQQEEARRAEDQAARETEAAAAEGGRSTDARPADQPGPAGLPVPVSPPQPEPVPQPAAEADPEVVRAVEESLLAELEPEEQAEAEPARPEAPVTPADEFRTQAVPGLRFTHKNYPGQEFEVREMTPEIGALTGIRGTGPVLFERNSRRFMGPVDGMAKTLEGGEVTFTEAPKAEAAPGKAASQAVADAWVASQSKPTDGSWDRDVLERTSVHIRRLHKRLDGWKTLSQLAVKDRRGNDNKRQTSKHLRDLAELGYTQVAWDKNGQSYWARSDEPLPAWLSQDDTSPAAEEQSEPTKKKLGQKAEPAKEPWQMTREEFEKTQAARDAAEPERANQIARAQYALESHRRSGSEPEVIAALEDRLRRLQSREYQESEWMLFHPETDSARKAFVEAAIAEGKPVPPEVLADYPDLQPAPPAPTPVTPSVTEPTKQKGFRKKSQPEEVSPEVALERYLAKQGWPSEKAETFRANSKQRAKAELRDEQPEYKRLKKALNAARAQEGKQMTELARQEAAEDAANGNVTPEVIKYRPVHELPGPLRMIIQQGAKALLQESTSASTRRAAEKIIRDAGSDTGAEVEKQKQKILERHTGDRGMGKPSLEPWHVSPIVQLFTLEEAERAAEIDAAMASLQRGGQSELVDEARTWLESDALLNDDLGEPVLEGGFWASPTPEVTDEQVAAFLQDLRPKTVPPAVVEDEPVGEFDWATGEVVPPAGQQTIFGEVEPPPVAQEEPVEPEARTQKSLFSTSGLPGQGSLFADTAVPDDLVQPKKTLGKKKPKTERERVAQQVESVFGADATPAMALMDAHAKVWAKATGRPADEWYQRISEVRQGKEGEEGEGALYQEFQRLPMPVTFGDAGVREAFANRMSPEDAVVYRKTNEVLDAAAKDAWINVGEESVDGNWDWLDPVAIAQGSAGIATMDMVPGQWLALAIAVDPHLDKALAGLSVRQQRQLRRIFEWSRLAKTEIAKRLRDVGQQGDSLGDLRDISDSDRWSRMVESFQAGMGVDPSQLMVEAGRSQKGSQAFGEKFQSMMTDWLAHEDIAETLQYSMSDRWKQVFGRYLQRASKEYFRDSDGKLRSRVVGESEEYGTLFGGKRPEWLEQQRSGIRKAAVRFAADGKATITAFQNADVSSLAHEVGHIFRRSLAETDATLLRQAEDALNVKDGDWTVNAEEAFASGFERYLRDGKAPTAELKTVFQRFKEWLTAIYQSIVGTPLEQNVSPELKSVFDQMLGGKKKRLDTKASDAASPMFREQPPTDESEYVPNEEVAQTERSNYFNDEGERIARSRATRQRPYPYAIGQWKIDNWIGPYGRPIEQLRMLDVDDIAMSEEDYTKVNYEGRGDDAQRYAEWIKEAGTTEGMPPISVNETDDGKMRVVDGHRRLAAAKLAGQKQIPAWVSPKMDTGKHATDGGPIYTALSYEGALYGGPEAARMGIERSREQLRKAKEAREQPKRLDTKASDAVSQPESVPEGWVSLEEFYKEHYNRVIGRITNTKARQRAEDYASDFFLKLTEKSEPFGSGDKIVRKEVAFGELGKLKANVARKAGRKGKQTGENAQQMAPEYDRADTLAQTPDEIAAAKEAAGLRRKLTDEALAELSPEDARVIRARYDENGDEVSFGEMAKALGLGTGETARKKYREAEAKFKAAYNPSGIYFSAPPVNVTPKNQKTGAGAELLRKVQADAKRDEPRVGTRTILESLARMMHARMIVARSQTTSKRPGAYHSQSHAIFTKSGASANIGFHELGHALFDLLNDHAELPSAFNDMLTVYAEAMQPPNGMASAVNAHEGMAEALRVWMQDPGQLPGDVRDALESEVASRDPKLADALSDARVAYAFHAGRPALQQWMATTNDSGKQHEPRGADAARDAFWAIAQLVVGPDAIVSKTKRDHARILERSIEGFSKKQQKLVRKMYWEIARSIEDTPGDIRTAQQILNHAGSVVSNAIHGTDPQTKGISVFLTDAYDEGAWNEAGMAFAEVGLSLPKWQPYGRSVRIHDGSLADAKNAIGKQWEEFTAYGQAKTVLYRLRRAETRGEGYRYPGMDSLTPGELQAAVAHAEAVHPEWERHYRAIQALQDQSLLLLWMSGEKSVDDIVRMKSEHQDYWTLPRQVENQPGGTGSARGANPSAGVRRAKLMGSLLPFQSAPGAIEAKIKNAITAYYDIAAKRAPLRMIEQMRNHKSWGKLPADIRFHIEGMMVPLRLDIELAATVSEQELRTAVAKSINATIEERMGEPLEDDEAYSPDDIVLDQPHLPIFRARSPRIAHAISLFDPRQPGKRQYYYIQDRLFYQMQTGAGSVSPEWFTGLMRVGAEITAPWKRAITQSLAFAARNLPRDVTTKIALHEGDDWRGYVPGYSHAVGLIADIVHPDVAERMATETISHSTQGVHHEQHKGVVGSLMETIKEGLVIPGYAEMTSMQKVAAIPGQVSSALLKPIDLINWATFGKYLSGKSEIIGRAGAWKASIDSGKSPLYAQAIFDRATGNFSQHSRTRWVAELFRFSGFANPAVQIMWQLYDTFTHPDPRVRRAAWTLKAPMIAGLGAGMAASTVLAWAMLAGDDDDEWERLTQQEKNRSDWDRTRYFHVGPFKMPFEYGPVGALQSATYVATMDWLLGHKGNKSVLAQSVLQKLGDTPGLLPPIAKTGLELATNYSFFYDREIVDPALRVGQKANTPGLQAWDDTPEWYKTLGRWSWRLGQHTGLGSTTEVSPEQIRYGVRSLLTSLADDIIATGSLAMAGKNPLGDEMPDAPVVGRLFVREPRGYRSQPVQDLREQKKEFDGLRAWIDNARDRGVPEGEVQQLVEKANHLELAAMMADVLDDEYANIQDMRDQGVATAEELQQAERRMTETAGLFVAFTSSKSTSPEVEERIIKPLAEKIATKVKTVALMQGRPVWKLRGERPVWSLGTPPHVRRARLAEWEQEQDEPAEEYRKRLAEWERKRADDAAFLDAYRDMPVVQQAIEQVRNSGAYERTLRAKPPTPRRGRGYREPTDVFLDRRAAWQASRTTARNFFEN